MGPGLRLAPNVGVTEPSFRPRQEAPSVTSFERCGDGGSQIRDIHAVE